MFKCFFCYGVRLGTKSIITSHVVCFFRVKRQKVPATDEITSKHENGITPKEQFSFKFQDNLKIQNKYAKCESCTPQKLINMPEMKFDFVLYNKLSYARILIGSHL